MDTATKPLLFFVGFPSDVFQTPHVPAYNYMSTAIFYSEIWGDYFGYFQLGQARNASPAVDGLLAYAGRVNLVGLFPTLLLVAGLLNGVVFIGRLLKEPHNTRTAAYALLGACSLATVVGFVWFLYRYPTPGGDTAKATYTLHLFPLLALLAAQVLMRIRARTQWGYWGVVSLLGIVSAYILPMMFTRMG